MRLVETVDGLQPNISSDNYHASSGISSSQLKYALKCPALYKAHCIDKTMPPLQGPALDLGTLVHAMVLEPHTVDDIAIIKKKFSGVGARTKAAEFASEHEGKLLITQFDWDRATAMSESVLSMPYVEALLSESQNELSGWYKDTETDLLCRYRPDIRTDWIIADLKTCTDASHDAFSRTIDKFGYAISAAHYLTGDTALMGTEHRQFAFICVESSPPYLTAMYILEDEAISYGDSKRSKALSIIKNGLETGIWPGYNHGMPAHIDVPGWAKRDLIEG